MQQQIETLIEDIVNDYAIWQGLCSVAAGETEKSSVKIDMFKRFKENMSYKTGVKYIKIFNEKGSVWGFVVNTDKDVKFKKGDILKAAGYNAPARNQARGNIIDGDYSIRWTGPNYLN